MNLFSHLALLSLALLLLQGHLSWAKGRGGLKSSFFGKKIPSTNKGNTGGSSRRPGQGTNTQQGNYPRQPQNPNQNPGGGYAGAGGGNPGGYPNQYGGRAYPGGGSYPGSYPNRGGPGWGQQGGYGWGNPAGGGGGGYPNWNPNNQILSPRYGGGYGYGGGGYGMGGSPFSRSVSGMGLGASAQSKGFGRNAAMAAGVGAMAGMAVGYGLGRFPRPLFHFHSPQEEYYYNRYMYRRYGSRSTDDKDYGRDYQFKPPPLSYDNFMDGCMKRSDLFKVPEGKPQDTPGALNPNKDTPDIPEGQRDYPTNVSGETIQLPGNSTASGNPSNNSPVKPTEGPQTPDLRIPGPPGADPVPPVDVGEEDDDTVSMMEIGYPELIDQLKARRCVELYIVYSERYMEKRSNDMAAGGAVQLQPPRLGLMLLLLLVPSLPLLTATPLLQ